MTKRHARTFFFVSTGASVIAFVAFTIDSHRQFPALTHEDKLTTAVVAGQEVWHRRNCINCHTLFGEGAYYAPDLTKIAAQRGDAFLRLFLEDPSRFYSEDRDRRIMPKIGLSPKEIDELIAFLGWVSQVDTQGWPPRPILVSGAAIPGSNLGAGQPVAASNDPIALGESLFRRAPPGCNACHSTAPGVNLVGPSLAQIARRAEERVRAPDYHGQAKDAAGYVRESILMPNAFLVPGATYGANGRSIMPENFQTTLTPAEVDQLVAYLMSLK